MVHFASSSARQRVTSNPLNTRDDVERLTKDLLDPLLPHFSESGARVRVSGVGAIFDEGAADLEGYARPLWGLTPLLAGGGEYHATSRWLDGIKAGTDPNHPEFWGWCVETDQRYVEMAAFGFSLCLAPKIWWDPLLKQEKENLNTWLLQINDAPLPPQNWRFFKIFVNLGLKLVGARYSQEAIDSELEFAEGFYDEHGWPTDGRRPEKQQTDYYATSFAIPFYSLVYSKLAQDFDPERCGKYRQRAGNMAILVAQLFSPEGDAIPFGRSMVYRFAMGSFWSAVAWTGLELPAPLTLGVVKGLALRHLRSFTQNGGMLNDDGILTMGYQYPNPIFGEGYNSPQSPYWALKPLLILALDKDHPFWSTPEEAYPSEFLQTPFYINPSALQTYTHAGGHTMLLTSGQSCAGRIRFSSEKYGKFAYSSTFGFSVPLGYRGLYEQAADSMLALCEADDVGEAGERWRVREKASNVEILKDGTVVSDWKPWKDVQIKTWLVPPQDTNSGFHLRVHRITSKRDLLTAEGGFAVSNNGGGRTCTASSGQAVANSKEQGVCAIIDIDITSQLQDGSTGEARREGESVLAESNTNLISSRTVIPTLRGSIKGDGKTHWLACAVFAVPSSSGQYEEWEKMVKIIPSVPQYILG